MSNANTNISSRRALCTVLVPLRNELVYINDILTTIMHQDTAEYDVEFLLIDGLSTDGTMERIYAVIDAIIDARNEPISCEQSFIHTKTRVSKVKVILNKQKTVSFALNLGIHEARGDFIVRWDAHTEYAHDYIIHCLRVLEETGAWNVGGPARTKAEGYIQRAVAAAYHSPFAVGGARFHDENFEGYVDTVTYGCWRKQTLIALGGFDEELVRNQDDELNLRIIRAGGTVYQSPSIRSWYRPRKKLKDLFRQYLQYGYWKVRVIRKHRLPASPRHLIPVVFVAGLLLGPLLGLIFPVLFSVYAICLLLYSTLLLGFSAASANRCGWDLILVLPIVFMTYHISYGLGFLAGLVDWIYRGNSRMSPFFTGLSR